ncbi:hypothetical protein ACA910_001563 [Epithemia clementina (nom. ined.)]
MPSIHFKYLDVGKIAARGGAFRFYLLANGIPYEETLFKASPDSWGVEKKRLIESGENPCGTVPVVYLKDDKNNNNVQLSQHIAISRYLARTYNIDSGDAYKDYIQDLVADEYQGARNAWVDTTFKGTDEQKAEYRNQKIPETLKKFDALYQKYKTADPYLSTSTAGNPLWGDSALFALLYDQIQTGYINEDDLATYPNLAPLYHAYSTIPAVAGWIKEKDQRGK